MTAVWMVNVDRIKHNLNLKLIALAMSIIACIAVNAFTEPNNTNTIAHRIYTIPIKFVPPGGELVYSADVKEVVVTLSGTLDMLDRISPELISADVNLSGRSQPGNNLETVNVMVPGGITMTSVEPAYIWVRLSKLLVKHVPVRVELQGQVESGYSIGKPEIAPETLRVSGADTKVDSVVALRAPLAIAHANSTFSAALRTLLPVNASGEVVRDVQVSDELVSVTVPVYTLYRVPVSLAKVKVATMTPKQKYTITVEPKTILCEALNSGNIPTSVATQPQTVWLDKPEAVLTLPLDLPRGVSLASGVSSNVVVTVTAQNSSAPSNKK
ncbi:MAG: hypothetical protein Q4F00_05250 [bacterium]|nr:hypothetical protein [bacterium]